MPLKIGETFAGYRVLRLLGSGGMGDVYLVQHPRLPRQDALKVLRSDISSDESFRERFIREADLAAGLRHPHIVSIHDRGEHDGQLWIAMDYIDGIDAARLLERKYPAGMPTDLVVRIISAVASALEYAHKKGLLHRDVKPANIIVADLDSQEPDVYLADFGIARPLDDISGITTTNMTVGTVAYAAPEQLMGEPTDGRADQYALAATTYHLLTGSQLFPNSNPAVVISRHLTAPVPGLADARPDLASLDPILAAALAKDPSDRFASCTDFASALCENAATQSPPLASAPTTPAPIARRHHVTPETHGAAVAQGESASSVNVRQIGISVAAVLLLLVIVGMLWQPWQHPQSIPSAIEPSGTPTTPTPSATAATPPPATTSSVSEPPPTSTATAPPEAYFTDVRRVFSDWNHGQGMPVSPDANRVLGEVFAWVCQHQDTDPNVVNQQIQMQETWFNHPSLQLYEANRLRSIAMSYCAAPVPPTATIAAIPAPTIETPSATPPRTTSPATAPEPVDPASWICDSIRAGNTPGKAMAAAQERFGMTQADAYLAYSKCS